MLDRIAYNFSHRAARPALYFEGRTFTYGEFGAQVAAIQAQIESHNLPANSIVGVVAHNDLATYASLLAILFSGHGYLPVHPNTPSERNNGILQQAQTALLLSSDPAVGAQTAATAQGLKVIATAGPVPAGQLPTVRTVPASHFAYLLFTSGSTGVPKGVPITRANLDAFITGFFQVGVQMDEHDRVLQMFELTFDFSVMSCFVPWVVGACLYPAATSEMKFMSVYRLLEEQDITVAPMVPSALAFLRPYFDEIRLNKLRYSIFCGEPLLADVAAQWLECAPGGQIINFYGPTEATVFCSAYHFTATNQKALNGAVSIGKAMPQMRMVVVNEQLQPLGPGQPGEICLAGKHLTTGYWQDEAKNHATFFEIEQAGQVERFYRTGDLGYFDKEGDFLFQGRLDQQVKVQGFRIELSEIEHHARACQGVSQVVALAVPSPAGLQLVLCVENYVGNPAAIAEELRSVLPGYMVPTRYETLAVLPLNKNGKIDRPALRQRYSV